MDWRLVCIAFVITFIAELGDKTQLTIFSLVSEHRNPFPVFLGASIALVLVSAIGSIFGKVMADRVPSYLLQMLAGLMFLVLGSIMLFKCWRSLNGV